jgi:transposase
MEASPKEVLVTARQRAVLERLVRARSTSQQLGERLRVVLMSSDGKTITEQAEYLRVDRQRVRRWRRRWSEGSSRFSRVEADGSDKELEQVLLEVMGDRFRSGAPSKFSAEQVAQIIALACEDPEQSNLPVSHWTPPELAREAMARGIVESISPRQVDRFLKRSRLAPAQNSVLADAAKGRPRGLCRASAGGLSDLPRGPQARTAGRARGEL